MNASDKAKIVTISLKARFETQKQALQYVCELEEFFKKFNSQAVNCIISATKKAVIEEEYPDGAAFCMGRLMGLVDGLTIDL